MSKVDSIKVVWNDGKVNLLGETATNQLIQIKYDQAQPGLKDQPKERLLFQESLANVTDFKHRENEFNEYKEQTLLPHMFSKSGPFIATGDVNKDGEEDFYV